MEIIVTALVFHSLGSSALFCYGLYGVFVHISGLVFLFHDSR